MMHEAESKTLKAFTVLSMSLLFWIKFVNATSRMYEVFFCDSCGPTW